MAYDVDQFAQKYLLSVETAAKDNPAGGLCGHEAEWNLVDSDFRPLLTIGAGPSRQSFVNYLRSNILPRWNTEFSQLEIFHWMVEWATRPYYSPRGAVYEMRLMEALLINGLAKAGRAFGESLYSWHGNLLALTSVDNESIPDSWHIAKRRYLERCVALYGDTLATAGIHSNLSLPEPMLAWDFMHLPSDVRRDEHLDNYKNRVYITATRILRAFASLFIATGASTPLQALVRHGRPVVVLTEFDSVRNLTFPNPPSLDLPDLYRTYQDYLDLSYDLVRRGVRFGNNNWTPVRARSFAEPVERLIAVTSDQLGEVYSRGLYAAGEATPVEEMARRIEIQNLLARINLPMGRVEVRTDDGGNPLELDIANLTLKHLLVATIYADDLFGRAFRYDREDIDRVRRNEYQAARAGLRSEIENPFTGKLVDMRGFLRWTLDEVRPLAEALGLRDDLAPLEEMAQGAPNQAEVLRQKIRKISVEDEVPVEVLVHLAEERNQQVLKDMEWIAARQAELGTESIKLESVLQRSRDSVRGDPLAPVRFRPRPEELLEPTSSDKTGEIVQLSKSLIRIPSVTACPNERLDEVGRAATLIYDYLRNHGMDVQFLEGKYPAILAAFPGWSEAGFADGGVLLSGHFDVVEPEPDDQQFEPRIEGDYLWGRGAADMKTVVATYLVWMKDRLRAGGPYPNIRLLLVGNEENGEGEAMGTPFALAALRKQGMADPQFFIAGERTEESGKAIWGEVCTENRGVARFDLIGRGQRGHSGVKGASVDLSQRLLLAQSAVNHLAAEHLTLKDEHGWVSQVRFPFVQVGDVGVYNVTPAEGVLGVEVRSIPQDDLAGFLDTVRGYCDENGLEMRISVNEPGVICAGDNPYLQHLIAAVTACSGEPTKIGRKLPGTSARFAPGGQAVVWGQSGIGPHSKDERHHLPSILPYYQALEDFAQRLPKG